MRAFAPTPAIGLYPIALRWVASLSGAVNLRFTADRDLAGLRPAPVKPSSSLLPYLVLLARYE